MNRSEVVLRVSVHLVELPTAFIMSSKFLRNLQKDTRILPAGFRFIMSANLNTMMSSLRNEAFNFFGCLHEIVQFGIF
jgi:hypothetical protein